MGRATQQSVQKFNNANLLGCPQSRDVALDPINGIYSNFDTIPHCVMGQNRAQTSQAHATRKRQKLGHPAVGILL
jgi:hypothetical protein